MKRTPENLKFDLIVATICLVVFLAIVVPQLAL
jgi:hypothetical protein